MTKQMLMNAFRTAASTTASGLRKVGRHLEDNREFYTGALSLGVGVAMVAVTHKNNNLLAAAALKKR